MPAHSYNTAGFGCGPSSFGKMQGPKPLSYSGFFPQLFPKLRHGKKANDLESALKKRDSFKPGSPGWKAWDKIYRGLGGTDSPDVSAIDTVAPSGDLPWGTMVAVAGVAIVGSLIFVSMKGKRKR